MSELIHSLYKLNGIFHSFEYNTHDNTQHVSIKFQKMLLLQVGCTIMTLMIITLYFTWTKQFLNNKNHLTSGSFYIKS